jgi:eukaryotic-like serine/threonine-protein kinase
VLFEPGFRFDGYELLVKIGQGGMASVWLGRTKNDHDEEVLVAIKTILPELAAIDDLKTMMIDEAKIVTALESPHVAGLLKIGEVWGIPYLVLEYVAGESIDHLCETVAQEKNHIPSEIVARILVDTCEGLEAAHELRGEGGAELGLVHRDLSPQNVLVNERGQVKLIDFGIAKAKERNAPETAEGVMKGKIPFMAPEHAMGGDVDRRSDLWSLGAVAYLMLSGKEPHEGPNDAARLIRKLSREPLAPLPPEVPEGFGKVVLKALSHSPDDRYPTASALAAAIREAVPPASCAEVADFVRRTLGETIRAREMMVERSIVAANARARARNMMSKPDFPSYSGELVAIAEVPATPDPSPAPQNHVSLPPPAEPNRPWAIYVTAAAIALAVVLAYALGATSNRSTASGQPSATTLPKASASPPLPSLVVLSSAAPSVASVAFTASSTPQAPQAPPSGPLHPYPAPSSTAPPQSAKPLVLPSAKPTPTAAPSGPSGPSGPKPAPEETIF